MSVKFNVVERGNPADPAAPKKYYPSIVSSGRTSMRQLMVRINQICTVSNADTAAVLEAFLTVIPQELAEGNIVELGDFGSFWLRSSSAGVEVADGVRAAQIGGIAPRFNPGKEFRKVLEAAEFEKA